MSAHGAAAHLGSYGQGRPEQFANDGVVLGADSDSDSANRDDSSHKGMQPGWLLMYCN